MPRNRSGKRSEDMSGAQGEGRRQAFNENARPAGEPRSTRQRANLRPGTAEGGQGRDRGVMRR